MIAFERKKEEGKEKDKEKEKETTRKGNSSGIEVLIRTKERQDYSESIL